MKLPPVSIISPTYNHEAFIGECIQSVLSQSYQDWEMVIIDDDSTDRTYEIACSFAAQDSRIHVIKQDHKGRAELSETYNTGLGLSHGEWIAILEGDDYWLPDKLEKQIACCSDQVIICYGQYLDKFSDAIRPGIKPPFTESIAIERFIPIVLLHQSHLIAVTALYRRESLTKIGGFHQDGSPAAVDMATLMRLIELPGLVYYVPENLGVWRHHPEQSTNLLGVELAKFNASLVFDYLDKLSERDCSSLGIDKTEVISARNATIASTCFAAIRQKLRDRSRTNMIPLIKDLWQLGNTKRKLEAIAALLAYSLHANLEFPLWMAERLNTKQISSSFD